MPRLVTKYVDATESIGGTSGRTDGERSESLDSAGLLTVHTADGACHVFPGQHSGPTTVPDSVLEAVDGIVLEEAATRYEHLRLDELRGHEQYERVLRSNVDGERRPVFVADVPPKGGREACHTGRYPDTFLEIVVAAVGSALLGAVAFVLGFQPHQFSVSRS
jgi:hypothetical protein